MFDGEREGDQREDGKIASLKTWKATERKEEDPMDRKECENVIHSGDPARRGTKVVGDIRN